MGAPTPNFDRIARIGLQLTSCYSEPSCSPPRATLLTGRVPNRQGLHRPPLYGEAGGLQGEITLPQLLSESGYVTQAVGKWQVGEHTSSQPQNVGFDDFYGFLSVSDIYPEWRDPHYFPEFVYSPARTEWVKNMPFNHCFVHATKIHDRIITKPETTFPPLPAMKMVHPMGSTIHFLASLPPVTPTRTQSSSLTRSSDDWWKLCARQDSSKTH